MPPSAATAGSRAFCSVELALDQLALDLEPDDEEEHRHEPVVHPTPEGLADSGPDADRVGVPTLEYESPRDLLTSERSAQRGKEEDYPLSASTDAKRRRRG